MPTTSRTSLLLVAVLGLSLSAGALASCKTDADCPSSYCANDPTKKPPYMCHACGDNCCLTDKDCPSSYCVNDPTKMPPYMCHASGADAMFESDVQRVGGSLAPSASQDADKIKKEVEHVLHKYQSVVAGATIAVGTAVAFFGYKLVGPTLFLAGAAAGGFATYVVMDATISDNYERKPEAVIATSLAVALVAGIVLVRLRKIGVFVAGAAGGAVAALMLNTAVIYRLQTYAPKEVPSLYLYVVVLLLGLFGGYLALKLERTVLIVATALAGSFGAVAGVGYFAGHYPTSYQSFVHNDQLNRDPIVWAYLGGMVAMTLLGVVVQLRTTEKRRTNDEKRQALLYAVPAPTAGAPRSVNVASVAGYV